MSKVHEIIPEKIKLNYDFKKVLKMSENNDGIFPGNKDVQRMLEVILEIEEDDKHIFLSSEKGTQIEKFLIELLKKKINMNKIFDWCYIYNFEEPEVPKLIKVKNGQGKVFKDLVERSVEGSVEEVKVYFISKEMKDFEKLIKNEILEKGEKEIEILKNEAKKMGFSTHITEKGVFFIPVIDGKKINEKEYDALRADEQENIIRDLDVIEKKSNDVMDRVKKIKKASKNKIKILQQKIVNEVVEKNFAIISPHFLKDEKINKYISDMKSELELNLIVNIVDHEKDEMEKLKAIIGYEDQKKENINKFKVNLLEKTDCNYPVIYANKFSYYELFGKIEYKNELGVYTTDFTLIKPGLMHQANSGYLIINVNDLINSKLMWEKLKKTLVEKTIFYESIREHLGGLPIKTIRPEKMPLDVKVILVGEERIFQLLYAYEPEFKEIFSYHIVVKDQVDFKPENIADFLSYFKNVKLNDRAKKRLIEYGVMLTGNRNKITTKISELDKIIKISTSLAKKDGKSEVKEEHIIEGRKELKAFNNHYDQMLKELINKEQLIIDVKGSKVGQINGLSVSSYVDYQTARPIRITATSHAGEDGIISIEKENKLNGKIFGKGVSIIKGYLSSIFNKEKYLSINCLLCFEQVYGLIDGDSASCAEVYAILSSLSNIPIKQNLAITGSLDQLGNVQPIGSVSKKIEGFYEVCKLKGFTSQQGVIIPEKNKDEIILEDEIIDSIKDEKFHIYSIDRIEEGIPLLMNSTFEEVKEIILDKWNCEES